MVNAKISYRKIYEYANIHIYYMSRKKTKMSNAIPIRLPPEVVIRVQRMSDDSMVPFATLIQKFVVDRVKQLHPDLIIVTT